MASVRTVLTARELIERLVGYDTTSRNSNLELVGFVRDYLWSLGVDSTLVFNEDGGKANLYATIGPDDIGGVVLSGHTDVVPVDGQDWNSDPFRAVERDGNLYGRGTCDMKGFIAVALASVATFRARRLKTPVHLAFSFDEEVDCSGARVLIDHIEAHLPKPKMVIVGEPTGMDVVNAHKSGYAYETEVTGHEAHSSAIDKGANAIMAAGRLLGEIGRIQEAFTRRGDPSGRFDPPCSTVHVGTIDGGTACNIIPRTCGFEWEFRGLPGEDGEGLAERLDSFAREHVLPDMLAVSPCCAVHTRTTVAVPALSPLPGSPAEALALRLARRNETHTVSYGTEAGMFQDAGMPAVVCGPGSIDQAHKPDEYIPIRQIVECSAFMERLAQELRG